MPRSKGAMLILACLMLAGGIFYWQKQDGGGAPQIVHETPSAVRNAGGSGAAENTLPVILIGSDAAEMREPDAAEGKETGTAEGRKTDSAKAETGPPGGAETGPAAAETVETTETAAPENPETAPPPASETGGPEWIFATEPLLVNINTADQTELEKLPGIGPAKAAAILEYRAAHGPFRTVEDLMKVPGIKEGTFSKIKAYVTV